ncbi:ROK family protein [Streptomyces radicis]|uniref:ROK family protein n=1 Tax=Streptomyces radicis TaxID=1750517 RepID=A0A3A9VTK2_9ACTN|nr:ROK family protein [Streptomyces radicis]RKN04411.1 ROK family protein [Streptomyces radicis]RKN15179.1 ROK family protein [Streptomyces radicis]
MTTDLVAAVDIGGTKIAGALVDGTGDLLHRVQLPTPAGESADRVMAALTEVLGGLTRHASWSRVAAVGIGSAGPVDARTGTVSPVNIPGWRDFPLVEGVRATTGELPVTLVGDGAAIAAGEHWRGAARGRSDVLCMVVSTGVGGGLITDGRLRPGPTGNAGHIGHISVDFNGDLCPCGGRGCVERIASGTNIARYALAAGWRPADPEGDTTAAGVAVAARDGHPLALEAFDRSARALAAGIAATATLIEIETVVIGGGVSQSGEVLFAPLRRALREYATLPFVRDLEVVPAQLGTDAGLVGAAAACWSDPGTFLAVGAAGN